jgi:hypothetical protein
MTRLAIPWPIRNTLAGTAGMTAANATERRFRRDHRGPLDYDDSLAPGKIVAAIMHLGKVTDKEERDRPRTALELWLGPRHLARIAAPSGARAVGQRHLRRDADERHPVLVPTARTNASAVALAGRRDGDGDRYPCGVRRRRRDGR